MSAHASKFWLDVASGSLLPHYVLGKLAETMARFDADDPDEAAEMTRELDNVLADLGYLASLAQVFDARDATRKSELGSWAGHYVLFDERGDRYPLQVFADSISLEAGDTTIEQHTFADGKLSAAGGDFRFELSFEQPSASDDQVLAITNRRGQARCRGTVRLTREGQTESREVRGKRGSFTTTGADHPNDGDFAGTWAGVYSVRYLDTGEWREAAFEFDPRGGKLTLQLGGAEGTDISWLNNHAVFRVGGDADHRFGAAFKLDGDGRKQFIGAELKNGVERPVAGFLVRALAPRKKAKSPVRRLRAMAAAAVEGEEGSTEVSTAQTIEMSTSPKTIVDLPEGTERTRYALTLTLTGLPAGTDATVTIEDDTDEIPEPFMPIHQLLVLKDLKRADVTEGGTTRGQITATLHATQGETHSAAVYAFKLKHGDHSAKVRLEIYSLETLVIGTVDIPPLVRNEEVSIALVASGGNPPYRWTLDEAKLPKSLKWNPQEATITGSCDWATSQRVYLVPVSVQSSGVIQLPTTATLSLQVVEGEQVGGIGANWAAFIIGGLGGLAVLIDWLVGKFKGTSADKAADAVKDFLEEKGQSPSKFASQIKLLNDSLVDHTSKMVTAQSDLVTKMQAALDAQVTESANLVSEVNQMKRDLAFKVGPERDRLEDRISALEFELEQVKRQKRGTEKGKEKAKEGRKEAEEALDKGKQVKGKK